MAKPIENVSTVDRALTLLLVFRDQEKSLALAELSRRTGLDKSTALRLARTLAAHHFLEQNPDTSWRLGPALLRLSGYYQSTFDIRDTAEPLLRDLSAETGESAAIYVPEADGRVCLFRHDSQQSIRHHVRVGEVLPLELGAPGRSIMAFSGAEGAVYDEIRAKGYYFTAGERDPQVASLAVPIFADANRLFGALAVTGPPNRFDTAKINKHLTKLRKSAVILTRSLGGDPAFYGATALSPPD
jgi:DNA-binding IclR family transcriptional regulator